jgi:pimeloyl-ACP methyl ester carboxylesterase
VPHVRPVEGTNVSEHDSPAGVDGSRRNLLLTTAATLATASLLPGSATAQQRPSPATLAEVAGSEHWTVKRTSAGEVKLFLWRKRLKDTATTGGDARRGTILFVHGSSVSATPVFDLQIPGRPEASTMDWFARRGYDTWCVDCEGYGHSDKWRPVNSDVSCGADDLVAASEYVMKRTEGKPLLVYGASSGALRAGLFAQRNPERVQRLALDALVWTGEGSPTLAERKKRLPDYRASNRRPIDRAFVHSIFTRDHPGTSDLTVVDAFADAVLALDTSMPSGTYIDMSANLPVINPEKITVPTLVMRGQWDGIASFQDVANFFAKLPNPDKQFIVMPGIAHTSTRSKNWALVYHLLDGYFSQPAPAYVG